MSGFWDVFAVAAGGAIGALARWSLTLIATAIPGGSPPWGTTVANVLGCGLIGIFVVLADFGTTDPDAVDHWPRLQLAIRVGLIGSITTFSTFVAEAIGMWQTGTLDRLAIYLAANLVLGTAAFVVVSSWARSNVI